MDDELFVAATGLDRATLDRGCIHTTPGVTRMPPTSYPRLPAGVVVELSPMVSVFPFRSMVEAALALATE